MFEAPKVSLPVHLPMLLRGPHSAQVPSTVEKSKNLELWLQEGVFQGIPGVRFMGLDVWMSVQEVFETIETIYESDSNSILIMPIGQSTHCSVAMQVTQPGGQLMTK